MPTPAPVEPPNEANVRLYRAAVLAWRKAEIEELRRNDGNHKLVNTHTPNHTAARAVHALAPERTEAARSARLFQGHTEDGCERPACESIGG